MNQLLTNNKKNFLAQATIIEDLALPVETNVIWQAIWAPKTNNSELLTYWISELLGENLRFLPIGQFLPNTATIAISF